MKEKINKELLCVLRKDKSNQIVIEYVEIKNPFKNIVDELSNLCDKPDATIQQIVNFIQTTKNFEKLSTRYRCRYCVSLGAAYEGFTANNQDFIKEINQQHQLIIYNEKQNPDEFQLIRLKEAIKKLKSIIKETYILWSKAYAIRETYRLCREDKSILTFSHRIAGYSNPVYQLTPNFSIEIKTNFGYGRVSYFYTKLKYKNLDIIPFSEWVDYEFARFSEIIDYTKSHLLNNEYWLEAMEFSRDACNMSLTDEVKFVEKYVIDECEKMVGGLEELFIKKSLTFEGREKPKYSVDKKGHVLVEFRGEKISGAIDFISKIEEFGRIAPVEKFKLRIEDCNRRIQPILVEEAKILKIEIENLAKEKKELQPEYDKVLKAMIEYNAKRRELQAEMISRGEPNTNRNDTQKFEDEFTSRFPGYADFKVKYYLVTEKYRILTEHIKNNTKVRDNIISYNEKIKKYFEK